MFTLGSARPLYFFDRSADENIESARHEAQVKTAALEKASEELRNNNLQLSIELEKTKAEHLALEGKLASRTLTAEQKAAMIGALRGHKPVAITVLRLGDQEANSYATSILTTLQAAGMNVAVSDAGVMSPSPYGHIVSPASGADELAIALKAAYINFRVGGNTGDHSMLIVGLKPPAL